jgi:hypothetical protein
MGLPIEKVVPSPYNLHMKKPVSAVCEHGFVEYFYSKNDVRSGILEFVVEGNSEHLILPNRTFLKLTLELSGHAIRPPAADGGRPVQVPFSDDPDNDPNAYVINNIFHSVFESVDVYVGNQATTKTDKHNPYNAYIRTLCTYGEEPLNTYFELCGWSKDTAGEFNSLSDDSNKGLITRKSLFTGVPHRGEFIGRICSPLFFQEKVLPTQTGLRIVLKKASDDFTLIHEKGNFELKIVDAVLMVQKVAAVPALIEGYMKMMEEDMPFQYFLRTPSINYYTIEAGSSQFMRDDLFMGKLPLRVIIFMVDTESYHGHRERNPFNFRDYGLTEICLYKDGIPYPRPPLKLDVGANKCAEAYHSYLLSLGCSYSDRAVTVSKDDFMDGYTMFSYDMSPDQLGSVHPGNLLNMNSNVRLEMKFKEAVKQNITLLVYSEMEHLMEIHRDRKVTLDF